MEGISAVSASPRQVLHLSEKNERSVEVRLLKELERDRSDAKKLPKALALTAEEIVAKINELLKVSLPNGVQSLKPEEVTPEATAERIVRGSTAFFDTYAKQHPELEGEELLNSFVETIRGGISRGYDDAYKTLEALGAFEFEGVREGVEKTRSLIDEKLELFMQKKREELGIVSQTAADTTTEVLKQGGFEVYA